MAIQGGSLGVAELPATRADRLGPLLELRQTLPNLLAVESPSSWVTTSGYVDLLFNMGRSNAWFDPLSGRQGFVTVAKLQRDHLAWTDFVLRAKRAAITAGFSNDHGAKLTAAIGEFYSNVIEHSQRIETGYVAYSTQAKIFEFVVADSGIGVLRSLQTNPSYAGLGDSGAALELALGEGVSRHHKEQGHGYGFRPLFIGLANISKLIRFRSGDHGRALSRLEDGVIQGDTRQLSPINGLFCSVRCDVGPSSPR